MSDAEAAEFEAQFGSPPPAHTIAPDLSRKNEESVDLWHLVLDQVRLDAQGRPFALDLAAVVVIFREWGIEDLEWQVEKMRIAFREIYGRQSKAGNRS